MFEILLYFFTLDDTTKKSIFLTLELQIDPLILQLSIIFYPGEMGGGFHAISPFRLI